MRICQIKDLLGGRCGRWLGFILFIPHFSSSEAGCLCGSSGTTAGWGGESCVKKNPTIEGAAQISNQDAEQFVAWTRGLRAARIGALSVSIFGQRPQMLWRMLPASFSFKLSSFGPFFRWGVGYSTGASDVLVDPGEFRRKKDGWVAAHLLVWRISFCTICLRR